MRLFFLSFFLAMKIKFTLKFLDYIEHIRLLPANYLSQSHFNVSSLIKFVFM